MQKGTVTAIGLNHAELSTDAGECKFCDDKNQDR